MFVACYFVSVKLIPAYMLYVAFVSKIITILFLTYLMLTYFPSFFFIFILFRSFGLRELIAMFLESSRWIQSSEACVICKLQTSTTLSKKSFPISNPIRCSPYSSDKILKTITRLCISSRVCECVKHRGYLLLSY